MKRQRTPKAAQARFTPQQAEDALTITNVNMFPSWIHPEVLLWTVLEKNAPNSGHAPFPLTFQPMPQASSNRKGSSPNRKALRGLIRVSLGRLRFCCPISRRRGLGKRESIR
jgi:hypothetical protein